MRPTTEDLLRVRDGEPVDAVLVAEITSSPDLEHEVRRLREVQVELKSLPDFAPPADIWERVQEKAAAAEPTPESRWQWPARVAVAATVAAIAILVVGRVDVADTPQLAVVPQDSNQAQTTLVTDSGARAQPLAPPSLASFQAESRRLERLIAGMGRQPSLVNAATAGTLVELEDQIIWIDDRLSRARVDGLNEAQVRTLWAERVRLMNSIATVRYAQAQRLAF